MRTSLTIALTAAALAAASGCIVKDTTHTLLLDPDGGVTWIALERNVRSNEGEGEEGAAEEAAFLAAASGGTSDLALALGEIGAEWVEVRLLRDRRPFVVFTEARFAAFDELWRKLLLSLDLPGQVEMTEEAGLRRIDIELSLADDTVSPPDEDNETPSGLDLTPDNFEIVLTAGQFVAAEGFRLEGDRAVLDLPTDDEIEVAGGCVGLSLTWTASPR